VKSRFGTSQAGDECPFALLRGLLHALRRRLPLLQEEGQGLVEFAVAAVPLLIILLGAAQYGMAWNRKNDAVHLANEAVRMAVVCGNDLSAGGCASNPQTFICNVVVPEAHSDGIHSGSVTIPAGQAPNAATATIANISVPKLAPIVSNVVGNVVNGTASMQFESSLRSGVTCTF
jgi:hypothetical protein